MKRVAAFLVAATWMLTASTASGSTIVADWTGFTATTGTATLGSVNISATSSATAPFVTTSTNRFTSVGSGGWDAGMELAASANAIVASDVNANDFQQFDFSAPISGLLYIENFDSSSEATIIASGATSLSLVSGSGSISWAPSATDGGVLSSSNALFNGEGDAVLAFTGPVTSIRLNYSDGVGSNGVFYTFAQSVSTPEPAGIGMLLTASLGLLTLRRRRK